MGRPLNAGQFADKLIRRLSAAGPDIRAGIEAVTESPTEAAAAKAADWQAQMALPKTRERFEKGLRRVSLADWKKAALDKGVARVSQGVEAARSKIEAFANKFLPHAYAVSAEVKAMPGLTLDDGIARAIHTIRRMADFEQD